MTVSSDKTVKSHSGNGSQTEFPYDFKIFAAGDLTVIVRSSTGTETVKSLTSDYSVTNVGVVTGGDVVFTSAPASGETVVIRRDMDLFQETDYTPNDPFPATSHEDALDRLTFIAQQQQEELDRSIKLSRTNTMTSTEFTTSATDRASKVLAFDSSGELSVTQELGTFKGSDATVTTAAYVERDIIKSTTTAELNNVYICVAASVVGDSLTDTDHFALLVDAVSAATSATTATTQASTATTQAGIATTKAAEALSSKNDAETAKTAAETAQAAAETAKTAAETALDNFDDIYLGAKSSDPSVDNDGDALTAGDLYFNTTSNVLKYYTGSAWVAITPGISDVVSDTTPQLGGNLDVNGNNIVSTSNGDITIDPNGTGNVLIGNYEFDADQTVGAGQDNFVMTYDNSTGHVSLEAAAAGGAGFFQGENGNTGDTSNGKGDIFRTHEQELNTNTEIASGDNSGCFHSLSIASGVTLTVSGNLVIT